MTKKQLKFYKKLFELLGKGLKEKIILNGVFFWTDTNSIKHAFLVPDEKEISEETMIELAKLGLHIKAFAESIPEPEKRTIN